VLDRGTPRYIITLTTSVETATPRKAARLATKKTSQSADSTARYCHSMAGGGVVMVVLMILILPVAVMLGGAIWSALMGFLLTEDAAPADDAETA
jgi:hypothetical protein